MVRTAIILAGGFGTRLKPVIKDVPKPMAEISGKPFLEYLLNYLCVQGIRKSILSVGYKWEIIKKYFGDSYGKLKLEYSIEDEPLGTGGAILKAVKASEEKEVFIFNGDTFFNIDLANFYSSHESVNSKLSIALKRMKDFDRYGVVKTDDSGRIVSFEEKKFYEQGNINGGIYILQRELFTTSDLPQKFSFEKEVMEKYCGQIPFFGFSFDDYFIDIGIPEDYERAQKELPALLDIQNSGPGTHLPLHIDRTWTLFLDRDGVINKKIEGDYVRNIDQFEWLPGAKEAIVKLSGIFGRIIIVSNQQGVGKRLMSMENVEAIHNLIVSTIHDLSGKIDQIYFAPQLKEENSPMRKPGIGMAMQAQKDFPEIDFSKSVIVGDSISDMEFGKAAGMKTVFISHGKETEENSIIDSVRNNLSDFSNQLQD